MNNKKLTLILFGAALAAFWSAQASAGLVQLKKVALSPNVLGGGGRTEFEVLGYADGADNLFGTVGSSIYASCIEPNEFIGGNGDTKWYRIATLAGAPTSNNGITLDEADRIERILSQKFNVDLTSKATGNVVTADIKALQALLWEAAAKDLLNGVQNYGNATVRSNASGWVSDATGWIDSVTTYSLLSGKLEDGQWVDAERQDFVTFVPTPPGGDIPVPVPAPLLLFGTGLLGLYGALRRRA